jgi:hypothetical protein
MIGRMIQEIESYLMSPMRDAGDSWEQEERIFLCDLLAQLRAQRDLMGSAK